MFDNAAIGVALTDLEGKVLECNRTLREMLGYSFRELQAKTFAQLTHPEDRQVRVDRIKELATGKVEQYQLEKRYVRKNGSVLWVRVNVSLIRDGNGNPHLTVGLDGQLEIETAPGRETRITIILPVGSPEESSKADGTEPGVFSS